VVSGQQAAALPPEARDAAAVRLPAADAVGAVQGAEAAPQPEGPRALAPELRGEAAEPRAWVAPGASGQPSAALSALACRPGRLRSAPAPQPALRFAHATTGLRTVLP